MAASTLTTFTADAFSEFLRSRQEPEWLLEMRRAAWRTFEELPWPHGGLEEWRRTDIRAFRLDRFQPQAARPGVGESDHGDLLPETLPEALLSEGVELGGRTAVHDSAPVTNLSDQPELDPKYARQGVLFGSLDALLPQHEALLRPYFEERLIDPHQDRFAALQAAFWTGGTLLYVPRGVTIDKPLHAFFSLGHGGVDWGRQLVILEDDAEATLLAETAGGGDLGLHCGSVELHLKRGARLRYVNLQNWRPTVWHFAHHNGRLEADAQLQWTIAALGSKLAKVNQHVQLSGPGASAQVNGVMFGEGRQHLSYHTLQHHEAPDCRSDLLYKGALQDHARIVWRGMIKVDRDAQKTDGYQRNDNLMLSEQCRADSIPGLEIEADDVRCTHGATTSRVDEEPLFYARCRGLTRSEAARMIVSGFFQQVFDRITIESVREALGHAIARRIRLD